MNFFYFLLFLILSNFSYAQNTVKNDTADYLKRKSFLIDYKEKSKAFNKNINKQYSGEVLRGINRTFSALQKSLEEDVKDKMFYFDNRFISFVKTKIDVLIQNNPEINSDFNILIAKNNEPNAYNFGENTLVVNLGMFYFLDNEDQFVSVLAHEIAHAQKKHAIKKVIYNVNNLSSKKEEIYTLKKNKNQSGKAFDLYKSMLYSNKKIQRNNEIEADSLGYEYYKKTSFQKTGFVSTLQKLKDYDDQKADSLSIDIYKKIFDLPQQKFKEEWLIMEDFSKYNYSLYNKKISEDSLKTHPDITFRINQLKMSYPELNKEIKDNEASPEFLILSEIAKDRIIPNYYETEKYGLGIYYCLATLQEQPDNNMAKYYLGKLFAKIYEARKNYNLNRYLDMIDPKTQSQSYQQFLSLMWNFDIQEIKIIADFYEKSVS
ncbi:M48 family metalloprotease [Chryseobacterium sp. T1]